MSLAKFCGYETVDEMMTALVWGKDKRFGTYKTKTNDNETF